MADTLQDDTRDKERPRGGWHSRLAGIDRRWIFLVMFVIVLVPLLKPVRLPLSIGSPATRFYEAIESISAGSIVVMPFDYDPAFTAEVHPMGVAVMRRLFEKNVRVISLTMQPAGPPLADRAFAEVAPPLGKKYGVDFVNLGYKSGNEVVVLAIGTSFKATFPNDSHGTPVSQLPLMHDIDRLGEAKMLIEIAATSAAPIWVQQAQGRYHLAMVAGVTGVMAPEFFPYLQSGQVKGLLGGMAGAAEYETLVKHTGTATKGMDAQSLAHLLIIVLILLGNALFYLGKRRGQGAHAVVALAALVAVLGTSGCGKSRAHETTAVRAGSVAADTTRQGKVLVATFKDGPVSELRLLRDTSGGVVVYGVTDFPEGTRVSIQLIEPMAGGGAAHALAMTNAAVTLGQFTSQPLNPASGPLPPGMVAVRVGVSFAPGAQTDQVQNAAARGLRFSGTGMTPSRDHADYSTSLEAPL
jgi:hypothetical protein